MAVERLTRADDPRIAAFHDVRDGDLVRARGLFVAEGRFVVRRALEDRRYRVHSVLVNDAALADLASGLETIDPSVPVFVCGADDLTGIAGYHVHRGCLALVHRPAAPTVEEVTVAAKTLVVLEGVTNADNVGGVFRNAAAFAGDAVLLSPTCCDPLYRKAVRTSMGATLQVPFARADAAHWPGVLARVRDKGFTLVALSPREPAETLAAFGARPRASRLALIIGTEGAGLTPAVEATADCRVRIPTSGAVDSLNLAVAVGIALYTLATRTVR